MRRPDLNTKPLRECYAFELRIIIQNKPEDGMRGSKWRIADAWRELNDRIMAGDEKALRAAEGLL